MSVKSTNPIHENHPVSQTLWEKHASDCRRDLILKKLAVALIGLINMAALGTALYFIIAYCPVSSEPFIISPFIVGMLGALTYMKFPTCHISERNYSTYVNPTALIGKGLAYLFFAPLMLAIKHIDWTPYHDPICATRISNDLKEMPFEQLERKYGSNFDNLVQYGFIHKDNQKLLSALHEEYTPLKDAANFWREEKMENCEAYSRAIKAQEKCASKWEELKRILSNDFPSPILPQYDFTKSSTRVELWFRKHFCFHDPINLEIF